MSILTDESPMLWGKYEGESMCNVPADYFMFLYNNNKYDHDVGVYIRNNLDVFKAELKQQGK